MTIDAYVPLTPVNELSQQNFSCQTEVTVKLGKPACSSKPLNGELSAVLSQVDIDSQFDEIEALAQASTVALLPVATEPETTQSTAPLSVEAEPETTQSTAPSSPVNSLSAVLVISAISAIGSVCADLPRPQRLEMILPLAALVGNLSNAERSTVEAALLDVLKSSDDLEWFMLQCPAPKDGPAFKPLTMTQLLTMPPKQWLINNIAGAGDLVMIYGAPGCGKSFLVIDLIFAACLGQQFAMCFDVAGPLGDTGALNVAYCAGEGIGGLSTRFQAAAQHYGIEDIPDFTFFATTPQLYASKEVTHANNIRNFVNEWQQRQHDGQAQPLHILIIDTLHSATAGADENSAKDMGIVLDAAKYATQQLGCAVVLVHHTNKGGTAERGSSSLRGAMDCMIEVRRISDTGTKAVMHCTKLKDGEAWPDRTFDLSAMGDSVRIWWDEPSSESEGDRRKSETAREVLELLAENPERSLPAKKIAETIAKLPQSVNKVLARLVKEGNAKRSEDKRGTIVFTVTEAGIDALSQSGKV